MKKFLALALALVLAISTVACGKKAFDVDKITGEWEIGLVNGQDFYEYCEENGVDPDLGQGYWTIKKDSVELYSEASGSSTFEIQAADGGINLMQDGKAVIGATYDESKDTLTWKGSDGQGGAFEYTMVRSK